MSSTSNMPGCFAFLKALLFPGLFTASPLPRGPLLLPPSPLPWNKYHDGA
jgi:hypothetical protein